MTERRRYIPPAEAAEVAKRLRHRRQDMRVTQERLALKAGINRSTYAQWENGALPRSLPVKSIAAIELTLKVPEGWLLSGEEHVVPDYDVEAVRAVFRGAQWLTGSMLSGRYDPRRTAAADRWRQQGDVFAITWADELLYPDYVFDETGTPIPHVAKILRIFDGYRPLRIASWFESVNSMLHGKRPREILISDARAVIEAAKDHAAGTLHG